MSSLPKVVTTRIRDADTLGQELSDWSIDSLQVGSGAFELSSVRLEFSDLVVERTRNNVAKRDLYSLPRGMTGFSLFRPGMQPGHWCGFEVPENSILVNQEGREHFAVLPGNYDHISVLVDSELVANRGLIPDGLLESHAVTRRCIVPLAGDSGDATRRWLFDRMSFGRSLRRLARCPDESKKFREVLLDEITRLIGEGRTMQGDRVTDIGSTNRFALVRRACGMVEDRVRESISPSAIADDLGVHVRSLQRGFSEVFGMTPYQYIQVAKLRAARRTLRKTPRSSTTVSEVAIRFGFTELGRFSTRYRRMFGELPSATLAEGTRAFVSSREAVVGR